MDKKFFKIVLTGGPGAGKTTATTIIRKELSNEFKILVVPEIGTIVYSSGVEFDTNLYNDDEYTTLFLELMIAQINNEQFYDKIALLQKRKTIIICDRGVPDNFAYITEEQKLKIFSETGWTPQFLCDDRYDLVIHMVTAANGAESYYSNETNEARVETLEEARELDIKNRKEWERHPKLHVVDNSAPNFLDKVNQVIKIIHSFLEDQKQ